MKTLEFKTSKGKFVIKEYDTFNDLVKDANFYKQKICKLSEITEEQASEIVDSDDEYGVIIYQNYQTTSMQYFDEQLSAIESLHSLLKSKGIHLFKNPLQTTKPTEDLAFYDNANDAELIYNQWQEAEQKTFYNPFIYKL